MSVQDRPAAGQSPERPLVQHDGLTFRVPRELWATPSPIKRVLVIGQCLLNAWAYVLQHKERGLTVEHVLFNHGAELPDQPSLSIGEYDFQIVALPLRSVLRENMFLQLSYLDTAAVDVLFEEACGRMALFLEAAMKWNRRHAILALVANFMVPQQNPNGRLLPRYDLRNLVYFVERLNERLAREIGKYKNAFMLDIDQVSASIGRRYVQDDSVVTIAHGSTLANFSHEEDQKRIEPTVHSLTAVYNAKVGTFIEETWREAVAMYRTVRQIDPVKMVIVDLDDTLWRGVLAEVETLGHDVLEGWPLGVVEALAFLRKRGVILAIVSKNEEASVARIFDRLLRGRMSLESVPLRRINWRPKAQNIEELMAEAHLLPANVVFVDDNPVERASIAAAFPGLRVIGSDPYAVRRILLWSAETQVAQISEESARRGEMIQAQVQRETSREGLSREDFLHSLELALRFDTVTTVRSPHFDRAFELLNKTNQFNTTGRRWSLGEIATAFDAGLEMTCFFVQDRFTDHGLAGVIMRQGSRIVQFVMSCRVLGLDVESAALRWVVGRLRAEAPGAVTADLVETPANMPCRPAYAANGFQPDGSGWTYPASRDVLAPPSHIRLKTA